MFRTIRMNRIGLACAVAWVAVGLSGCNTTREANQMVDDAQRGIDAANRHAAESEKTPTVSTSPGAWLMGDTVVVTPPESPILATKMQYGNPRKVTLADVAAYLSENYGLPVDISDLTGGNGLSSSESAASTTPAAGQGVMPGAPNMLPMPSPFLVNAAAKGSATSKLPDMMLSYEGSIKGFLDVVAEKEGVWWKFEDGRAEFFRTMTKTIYMPAIARHSKTSSSIIAAGGPQMGTSTGQIGGGSSSSGDGTNTGSSSASSDYDLDTWKAIGTTAQTVAGGTGAGAAIVTASASLGGVTVTGTPTQVRHVEEWARGLSDNLSQMVKVSITLYTVNLNNEDNYAWNPQIAFNKLASAYGLSLSGPTVPSVVASGVSPFSIGAKVLSTSSNSLAGSDLVFNALSTIGKVSSVKTWSTLALNGQVSTVQMANQVTYAAQSGATSTANVGTTSTLTPGVVTTGLTGTIQPRIINGKVTLAMDLTDSVLNSIATFTSEGATIQEPNVSVSALPSSISLTPGQSLLATGVTENNGTVTKTGTFSGNNPLLGGGTDATTGQTLVVVNISAEVM
jgi:type IVB pilus formation R64 PilN family outer membrane protein